LSTPREAAASGSPLNLGPRLERDNGRGAGWFRGKFSAEVKTFVD
jgi:hypothetical protein